MNNNNIGYKESTIMTILLYNNSQVHTLIMHLSIHSNLLISKKN